MKINLTVKGKEQEILLAYLEENSGDVLAEKINNGVSVEKDGVKLIMKKDFSGFLKYALEEAKKTAEKGATGACVEDKVVFGWLMHYFEEDAIEGTLFNVDGTKYIPLKPITKKSPSSTITKVKKEAPKQQFSLFDIMNVEEQPVNAERPTLKEKLDSNIAEEHDDEELSEKSNGTSNNLENNIVNQKQKPSVSPFYEQYIELQKQYPSAVILMRLGDFYEVYGKDAEQLANELDITLTSRDVGLGNRVPIIGLPYHASNTYFLRIHSKHDMLIWENKDNTTFLPIRVKKADEEKHWIDEYTYVDDNGIIHNLPKPVLEIPERILKIFGNNIIAR